MSNTAATTASTGFVDRIDPFTKISVLKRKTKRSQGSSSSSRYQTCSEVELQLLPLLKGELNFYNTFLNFNNIILLKLLFCQHF